MGELLGEVSRICVTDAPLLLVVTELSDSETHAFSIVGIEAALNRSSARLERIETVSSPGWRVAAQTGMLDQARAAMRSPVMLTRLRHLGGGFALACVSMVANLAGLWRVRRDGHRSCSTALFHFVVEPRHAAAIPERAMADTWTT